MPGLTAKRNEKLEGVPTVDIPDGEFNYVLCKVFDTTGKDRTENKLVIRGEEETEFHVDIFDMLESILENIGMSCECLGGGKMRHNAATKDVHIFGTSQGYGSANHGLAAKMVQEAFPDYRNITWSDG